MKKATSTQILEKLLLQYDMAVSLKPKDLINVVTPKTDEVILTLSGQNDVKFFSIIQMASQAFERWSFASKVNGSLKPQTPSMT